MYDVLKKAGIAFCVIRRNGEVVDYSGMDDPDIIKGVVRLFNTASFIHESFKDKPEIMELSMDGKTLLVLASGELISFAVSSKEGDEALITRSFGGKPA
jgi:tricorn protease-like protein